MSHSRHATACKLLRMPTTRWSSGSARELKAYARSAAADGSSPSPSSSAVLRDMIESTSWRSTSPRLFAAISEAASSDAVELNCTSAPSDEAYVDEVAEPMATSDGASEKRFSRSGAGREERRRMREAERFASSRRSSAASSISSAPPTRAFTASRVFAA